ncbi:MAG: dTDP-4-dehydrorhamnose 3,5-epimerase family protein [Candidatus Falkowbacteria bacterium]
MFKFGEIEGVIVSGIVARHDQRGSLSEVWRANEKFNGHQPAMCYTSETNQLEKRGPHEHKMQTDLFIAIGPGCFVFNLWDNRPDSPTYGNMSQICAGENCAKAILIPPGVVHGYLCLKGPGTIINLPDTLYAGTDKKEPIDEIRYEDIPKSPFKMPTCK